MTKAIKKTAHDRTFDIINYSLLAIALVLVIYPLYFVIIASISDPIAVSEGKVILIPKNLTIEGYTRIFMDDKILTGYKNTIVYTFFAIVLGVSFTASAAFALSRKELKFRKTILALLTIVDPIVKTCINLFLV